MMKYTNRQVDLLVNNHDKKFLTEKYDTSVNFQSENEQVDKPYDGNKKLLEHCYEERRYNLEPADQYVCKVPESTKPVNKNIETDFKPVIKFVNDHEEYLSDIINPEVNYLTKEQRYQFKSFDKASQPIQLVNVEDEFGNRTPRLHSERKMIHERKKSENMITGRVRKLSDIIANRITSLARRKSSQSFDLENPFDNGNNGRVSDDRKLLHDIVAVNPERHDSRERSEFNMYRKDMRVNQTKRANGTSVKLTTSNLHFYDTNTSEESIMSNSDEVVLTPHSNIPKMDKNIIEERGGLKNNNPERIKNISNGVILIKSHNCRSEETSVYREPWSPNTTSGRYSTTNIEYREGKSGSLINDCISDEKKRKLFSFSSLRGMSTLRNKPFRTPSYTQELRRKEYVFCENNTVSNAYKSAGKSNDVLYLTKGSNILSSKDNPNNRGSSVTTQRYNTISRSTNNNHSAFESREIEYQKNTKCRPHQLEDIFKPMGDDENKDGGNMYQYSSFRDRERNFSYGAELFGPSSLANISEGSDFRKCYDDDDDDDAILNRTITDMTPQPISDWDQYDEKRSIRNKLSGYTISRKYRFK